MKKKGNPLAEFLIGLAMLAAGGYWFLNSVSVSTGFYTLRLGGFYMNGGLVVVPFIAGVIWFCVNTDSFGAKLLMVFLLEVPPLWPDNISPAMK